MKCTKCGSPNDDGAKFCKKCGAELLIQDPNSCRGCGAALEPAAKFCPKCGKVKEATTEKSKAIAVVLAVFFSFFSYLYTYRNNYWKFLVSSVIFSATVLLAIFDHHENVAMVSTITGIVLWFISVIDNAVRSSKYYSAFPVGNPGVKSKAIAVTLVFILGPFGLIYTWKKDWIWFLGMIIPTFILHGACGYNGINSAWINILPWLAAVTYKLAQPRKSIEA